MASAQVADGILRFGVYLNLNYGYLIPPLSLGSHCAMAAAFDSEDVGIKLREVHGETGVNPRFLFCSNRLLYVTVSWAENIFAFILQTTGGGGEASTP